MDDPRPSARTNSKKEQVESYVIRRILTGDFAPGERIPSEREMMQLTGTSRITVRSAYMALRHRGILSIQHGSGAYVSSGQRANPAEVRAVAILATLSDMFALEFIDALERAAVDHSAFIVLRQTDQDPEKEREAAIQLAELGIQNVVVWASGDRYDAALFRRLRVLGVNMVFFDRMFPGDFADYVGTDNHHGIVRMMNHAKERGASRFAFLAYEGLQWGSFQDRETAFIRECDRRGVYHEIVRVPWSDEAAHFLHGHGRDVMRILLQEEAAEALRAQRDRLEGAQVEALLCANDYLALQAKAVLPPGALVYGFDGLPEAAEHGITSYRHPMRSMAASAIELLVRQSDLGVDWVAQKRVLKGQLVSAAEPEGESQPTARQESSR